MLRRQLPVWSPLDARAIAGGLRGALGRAGEIRKSVEERLKTRYGARDVLLTDSGTTALRLALAHGVPSGGKAALPAYGCYDIATAADGAGCRVVLYDLDPGTLSADLDSLRAAVGSGVQAVVAAHLYGYPVDLPAVEEICRATGAILIEDAAQGAGGTLNGRLLGAWGSVSVLSFGRGKGVTAGRGGALLALDERGEGIVRAARDMLSSGGWGIGDLVTLFGQWALGRPGVYGIPARLPFLRLGETLYRPPWPPRGMATLAAGVLQRTLDMDGRELETRRRNAGRLETLMESAGWMDRIAPLPRAEPGYLRFPVLLKDGSARSQARCAPLGVMGAYPEPLPRLRGFGNRIENQGGFTGAQELASRLITLPTHSRVTERDLEAIESCLTST